MKKILLIIMAILILIPFLPQNKGFAAQTEPIIKVKLTNFLGNKAEVTLKPNGDFSTSNRMLHYNRVPLIY